MTFLAAAPLPRRLARRAHRHLSLPASRVALVAVDGGVHLDVAERAGVWFSPDEWGLFTLDALGLVLQLSAGALPPETLGQVQAALAAARAAAGA